MSLFSDAMQFAFGELEVAGGEEVLYTHNNQTFKVVAVPGQTQSQEVGAGGNMVIASRSLDFMIAREKLVLPNGQAFEPLRGDKIVRANGSEYKAFAMKGPVWQWSDPAETYYRISTVRSGKE
jgi:hypothetical protein